MSKTKRKLLDNPLMYEKFVKALFKNHGLITYAAKEAKISADIVYDYAKVNPDFQLLIFKARETGLDLAESHLFKNIQKGDTSAIKYYLGNQGKSRGYGNEGTPVINVNASHAAQVTLQHLNIDQLENLKNKTQSVTQEIEKLAKPAEQKQDEKMPS